MVDRSTKYDLPAPAKMPSRANGRPIYVAIDWSTFTAQPFESVKKAIQKYHENTNLLRQALTAIMYIAQGVQKSTFECKYFSYKVSRGEKVLPIKNLVGNSAIIGRESISGTIIEFIKRSDLTDIYDFVKDNSTLYDPKTFGTMPFASTDDRQQWECEVFDWIVSCGLHPDIDPTGEMQKALAPWAEIQPYSPYPTNPQSNYCLQRKERANGASMGAWPDLTRMLRNFVPTEKNERTQFDEAGITHTVMWFLRIAFDAARSYADWNKDTPSPVVCRRKTRQGYSMDKYRTMIEDPFAETPLEVRQVLASLHFVGNWEWMIRFVIPGILRWQSKTLLGFCVYRWVMRAALHPDIDSSGTVEEILSKTFKLDNIFGAPADVPTWISLNRPFYQYEELWVTPFYQHEELWVEDEVYKNDKYLGPDNSYLDFDTEVLCQKPKADASCISHPSLEPTDVCYICRGDYDDKQPCVKLNVCNHGYHLGCLQEMLDFTEEHYDILCAYCRRVIVPIVGGAPFKEPYRANAIWWFSYFAAV